MSADSVHRLWLNTAEYGRGPWALAISGNTDKKENGESPRYHLNYPEDDTVASNKHQRTTLSPQTCRETDLVCLPDHESLMPPDTT